MKRIIFAAMLIVTLIFAGTCAAQDVLVKHRSDDIDVYVMDDTLRDVPNQNYRCFKVSVKHVKDGNLQRVVNWAYNNFTGVWHYEIEGTQLDHTNPVIPRDSVFEFCMNLLGWSYRIDDTDSIVKFYI